MLPDGLRREIERACAELAGVRWEELGSYLQGDNVRCDLRITDTGKLQAFLSRRGSNETQERIFARRFDAAHPWEEVGSAQGFTEARLYDDRGLAGELAAWVRLEVSTGDAGPRAAPDAAGPPA